MKYPKVTLKLTQARMLIVRDCNNGQVLQETYITKEQNVNIYIYIIRETRGKHLSPHQTRPKN